MDFHTFHSFWLLFEQMEGGFMAGLRARTFNSFSGPVQKSEIN